VTIRNFDHVARRFGAQSVVERVVFAVYPQSRDSGPSTLPGITNSGLYVVKSPSAPGDAGWFEGDVVHIDLEALNASTDGTFDPSTASLAAILENVLDFSPPGTLITDVLSIFHDDGNYDASINQEAQPTSIIGLGTGHIEFTLDANPTLVSGGGPIEKTATGTVLFSGVVSPGDTVTMDGTVLTAVAGAPAVNEFTIGGSFDITASNFATAVNTYVGGSFSANAPSGFILVTISAATPGAAGNLLTMATSNPGSIVLSGGLLTGGVDGIVAYQMVGDTGAGDTGSPRRVFVELELTYPKGSGLTDTPDLPVTPDAANYSFGPLLENAVSQRPADMEDPLQPEFREGHREVIVEYVASENGAGAPIGSITTETFVSLNGTDITFLRRIFGSGTLVVGVTDATTLAPAAVNTALTEYGSSSRLVKVGGGLSGTGQSLVTVTYFAQDPIPNYGAVGGGYQVTAYYRSNSPQTVGTKAGLLHGGSGPLPETLAVEPLLMENNTWTGHTGVGSVDLPFPYAVPLDQIPVNDNTTGTFPGEWEFCASSQISIDDFNAEAGLLTLQSLVQAAESIEFSFGGPSNPPTKDIEFRAFYPFVASGEYRPTVMAQPLSGAVRHKVFSGFLARATEDSRLFRKDEVLLVVLTRWAKLDADNTILFKDTDNRTCAAVYRTRNLLLVIGNE
jgi:hypothetical protein